MSQGRITKRTVEMLAPQATVWDLHVKGFGVRRQRARRVYFLKARINGRQRWITIGDHGAPWTPETARKEAQRIWGAIRDGVDVALLRDHRSQRLRISDLCLRFLEEHADQHKKPSSRHTDRRNIENHLLPLLGDRFIDEVTRADIDQLKRAVRDGRTADPNATRKQSYRGGAVVAGGTGVANRCLALLSKMFNLAESWGLRPENSNPVRHVEKYREGKRERYLSPMEFARLGRIFADSEGAETESPYAIAALRLLILTGARLGEILQLRWQDVDFEQRALRLRDSKTGQKVIFLSRPALDVLTAIPRVASNPYVVVGGRPGQPLRNLQKPWGRIRQAAELDGVRIHDLRHSYASIAAAAGMSLPIIGKLLGHSKSATTERYAHLAADPLRAANEVIGAQLGGIAGLRQKSS